MANGRNWDAAKRREWQAQARKEKAMELEHESLLRQADAERRRQEPASERQIGLIKRWNMHTHYGHDDNFLLSVTKGEASQLIDKYATEHKWKKNAKTKAYHDRNVSKAGRSTDAYQPWRSSDITVTNTITGEVRIIKNEARKP